MQIDILSLFPAMFSGPLGHSILKRAQDAELLNIRVTNPRDFTYDKHHIVDDYPFGGGPGMVMKAEPIFRALSHVITDATAKKRRILLMCPGGEPFSQGKARELASYEQLVFICGHYEGVDERVRLHLVDETISIGDYVLTGGELPAMVMIDAIARMLPGVLGAENGAQHDSFYHGLLEYPQYTRPRSFLGHEAPEVLLSGDHARIERWRRKESLRNTWLRRPELLSQLELTPQDIRLLAEIHKESAGE